MAGHSKWANIKRRKGANDAKRSKLFTKLAREISMATKQGGPIPESNPRLRLAIQNARSANLPKDNIDRALKRGSSKDVTAYTEVAYEGYAAHGVAVIVECLTDNLNRTVAAVRAIFSKYRGRLGKSGSLTFLFDRKGVFALQRGSVVTDEEEFTLAMIEAGAENIELASDGFCITCPLEAFGQVQQRLEMLEIAIDSAELQYIPNTLVALEKYAEEEVVKLVDALEDHDDVQKVFQNMA